MGTLARNGLTYQENISKDKIKNPTKQNKNTIHKSNSNKKLFRTFVFRLIMEIYRLLHRQTIMCSVIDQGQVLPLISSKFERIKCQCCTHIETIQFICCANQLTGFYMRATLALNGLIPRSCVMFEDLISMLPNCVVAN